MVSTRQQSGFSLVELSIVLVILGLLVGGVLAGQSLIRAAELRATMSEAQRYITSVNSFRDKYFALPGDMNNATRFWGRTNSNADCVTNSSAAVASPGSCDGNGNGIVDIAAGPNMAGEIFGFWTHLANAGLIEGRYSGISGSTNAFTSTPNVNTPPSRLNNASWYMYPSHTGLPFVSNASVFDGAYNNWLQFGAIGSGSDNGVPVLKPEEAWNIDTKMDDGLPAQGKILARWWSTCSTATASSQKSSTYLLSSSNIGCALMFTQYIN